MSIYTLIDGTSDAVGPMLGTGAVGSVIIAWSRTMAWDVKN